MKTNLCSVVAASLIMLGTLQVNADTFVGTIQTTKDDNQNIIEASLITEDSQGEAITYQLVLDENGMAVTKQYENQQLKIEGEVKEGALTVESWSEIKESYNELNDNNYQENEEYDSDDDDDDDDNDSDEDDDLNEDTSEEKDDLKESNSSQDEEKSIDYPDNDDDEEDADDPDEEDDSIDFDGDISNIPTDSDKSLNGEIDVIDDSEDGDE